jgi:hypothetical protein
MAAEDSFRYGLREDNNYQPEKDRVCFWFNYIRGNIFPIYRNGNSTYKDRYNDHLALLNATFNNEDNSLFKLKWTAANGIGVFARRDLQVDDDDNSYDRSTGLSAEYQEFIKGINWSIGMITIPTKSIGGRPRKLVKKKEEEEKGKRVVVALNSVNTRINVSLVGPFDFINHACDGCAQLTWVEENATTTTTTTSKKKGVYCTVKRGKIIKKDDEVFINYREINSNREDVVYPYGVCGVYSV